jgi:RepB DNA-primase from phage plasmid
MVDDSDNREGQGIAAAHAMLDAFASAGATAFNLTVTDTLTGPGSRKVLYRSNRPLEEMRRTIGVVMRDAERNRHNVIIRPLSKTATLIQLDDLDRERARQIAPHAVIVFQTSPAKYQAWVAVEPGAPEDFRRRLVTKIEADISASGSTRLAGSTNFKPDYAPDFPRVTIRRTNSGNVTTMAALEQAGFVAPREQPPAPAPVETTDHQPKAPRQASRQRIGPKKLPSYEKALASVGPAIRDRTKPDRSKADFLFCMTALDWGFTEQQAADALMQVSERAQDRREIEPDYCITTARNAAKVLDRRHQPVKSAAHPG